MTDKRHAEGQRGGATSWKAGAILTADASSFGPDRLGLIAKGPARGKKKVAIVLSPFGRRSIDLNPGPNSSVEAGFGDLETEGNGGVEDGAFCFVLLSREEQTISVLVVGLKGGQEDAVDMHNDTVGLADRVKRAHHFELFVREASGNIGSGAVKRQHLFLGERLVLIRAREGTVGRNKRARAGAIDEEMFELGNREMGILVGEGHGELAWMRRK